MLVKNNAYDTSYLHSRKLYPYIYTVFLHYIYDNQQQPWSNIILAIFQAAFMIPPGSNGEILLSSFKQRLNYIEDDLPQEDVDFLRYLNTSQNYKEFVEKIFIYLTGNSDPW